MGRMERRRLTCLSTFFALSAAHAAPPVFTDRCAQNGDRAEMAKSIAAEVQRAVAAPFQLTPADMPAPYNALLDEYYIRPLISKIESHKEVLKDLIRTGSSTTEVTNIIKWSTNDLAQARARKLRLADLNNSTFGLLHYSETPSVMHPNGNSLLGFEFVLNANKMIEVYPAWLDADAKVTKRASTAPMLTLPAGAAHPDFFAAAGQGRRAYLPAPAAKLQESLVPGLEKKDNVKTITGNGTNSAVYSFTRSTSLAHALTSVLDLACSEFGARQARTPAPAAGGGAAATH